MSRYSAEYIANYLLEELAKGLSSEEFKDCCCVCTRYFPEDWDVLVEVEAELYKLTGNVVKGICPYNKVPYLEVFERRVNA